MNSLELVADLGSVGAYSDVAAMLRAQHEAIRVNRKWVSKTGNAIRKMKHDQTN